MVGHMLLGHYTQGVVWDRSFVGPRVAWHGPEPQAIFLGQPFLGVALGPGS